MEQIIRKRNIVVIGAGLTGLTTALTLKRKDKDVEVVECQNRIGGQMQTQQADGFTFESGPSTGVVSYPEVSELFTSLYPSCELEVAKESSKKRLIWKGSAFHPLPASLMGGVTTPLFRWRDKFGILLEPFRTKGTNPDETVGALTIRRLGRSYLDYAVDPFLSGVYAGDPMRLVTRYAMPKLYNLEQNYGSFIRGAFAKAKQPKSDRDKLATKKVFSVKGGFGRLIEAMGTALGNENITVGAQSVSVRPCGNTWQVDYTDARLNHVVINCDKVVTTCGSYVLPQLLPFVDGKIMSALNNLTYAPIIQVAVGIKNSDGNDPVGFGGLVPSLEKRDVLGILFPSSCFEGRTPDGGVLFSFFIGGIRHPECLQMTDEQISAMVTADLSSMLGYKATTHPDLVRVFRHSHAIPQYEANTGERLTALDNMRRQYPGLIIAGNMWGGIGMADRIRQAVNIAEQLVKD